MIAIIIGMHRSGTSALSGVLHDNRIVMGREDDFYPPPMKENPKGFFENVRFRRLNDKILAEHGYKVKSFSTTIPLIENTSLHISRKMKDIILNYTGDYDRWGFKDPRTCLTLYCWLAVIHSLDLMRMVKVLQIHRDFNEIQKSMKKRGNKETEDMQFVNLADTYTSKFSYYFHKFNRDYDVDIPHYSIRFTDLINFPDEVCTELSEFLNMKITDYSFIDPRLANVD